MTNLTPRMLKFFNGPDGFRVSSNSDEKPNTNEVKMDGLHAVDIRMRVDEVVSAKIELISISELPLDPMRPIFVIRHPVTGDPKEISTIIFTDGSSWRKP